MTRFCIWLHHHGDERAIVGLLSAIAGVTLPDPWRIGALGLALSCLVGGFVADAVFAREWRRRK